VNPLEYVHFDSRVIDDFSFDDSNSNSDGETNVPLDDLAHVVKQFEHENKGNVNIPRMTTDDPWLNKLVKDPDDKQLDHNKLLAFCGRDVNEGKCVGLKGRKPKTVDDDECETSKQGSKKGDGRKTVNETLSKVVKEIWNKKKEIKKKRAKQCVLYDHEGGLVDHYSKLWQYRQAILDTNPGFTCVLENEVNDEDRKLYFSRDANNHMFPIAWAVVGVENNVNCSWFLSLVRENLNLGDGEGINIISDGHKGAAATSMESVFLQKMEEFKMLNEKAHEWLVERNPNSWCRAYFEMDRCSAPFENGILQSFNSRIVGARGNLAFDNKDSITPSVRRQMEYNKRIQRHWLVFSSSYREVEVRKGDQAFGVNLHQMKCVCNMWQLSGIPCVHYLIKPVYGPKFWKPASQPPPLPPIERKMTGRLRLRRIRHPTEDDDHVPLRVGRVMHCNKCCETGNNKTRCPNQERPKSAYLRSKGIVFQEAPSSSMPPPTSTPSTSNTMSSPPTPSSLNTMPPPPTPSPSISNTMPPLSGSNTMPPPPTPSGSNTMPSHATPGSNSSTSSNTMPSTLTGTNKGKCPLIPKRKGRHTKSNASSSKGGSRGGSKGGYRGGASKRSRGSSKR
ncbi:multidrug resistance-associated protein 5, partial [Tanacetum coccineum]